MFHQLLVLTDKNAKPAFREETNKNTEKNNKNWPSKHTELEILLFFIFGQGQNKGQFITKEFSKIVTEKGKVMFLRRLPVV